MRRLMLAAVPLLASGALAAGPVRAANPSYDPAAMVRRATDAVRALERTDAKLDPMVWRAKGVFIVPRAGRFVPLAVGAEGIALARRGATWTGPAFYDLAGGGFGKAGRNGPKGAVVALLMTAKAVKAFEIGPKGKVAFGPGSGLRMMRAPAAQATNGPKPDVILWAASPGHDLAARLDRAAIAPDPVIAESYYGNVEKATAILAGAGPRPGADALWRALSG